MAIEALRPGALGQLHPDWPALARRARRRQYASQSALFAFLVVVSLPIILPYFSMVVISFTARSGGTSSDVLWIACAIIVPSVLAYGAVHQIVPTPRLRLVMGLGLTVIAALLLAGLVGVWTAFRNSLALALSQILIILTVASLAGYYVSRFAFAGREAFLQSLLVLHAFPAITLIIPIFLILYWIGLLDTILGVMLVLTAIELPFYVFVMKGFFDGVPWDIEMSAMTDGATRRQAFRLVVLRQVRVGLIAVAVFAFIRAWEEYIFVRTFLIENKNWVMSLYLYWVADDVMGVDYGIVVAVSVFYGLPSLLLYVFCQKIPDPDDHW